MPTDDCHVRYRNHLDNMQQDCALGAPLYIWKVTFGAGVPSETYVIAKDATRAVETAAEYRERGSRFSDDEAHTVVAAARIGPLAVSAKG